MLRDREVLLRFGLAAPVDADLAGEPDDDLRAVLERLEPAPEDLARLEPDLLAPSLLLDREPLDREPVERLLLDLRAPPLLRDDEPDDEEPDVVPALALPSIVHLPDITR